MKGITGELGVIPNGNGAVLTYQIQTVYIVSDKMDILVPSDTHGIGMYLNFLILYLGGSIHLC